LHIWQKQSLSELYKPFNPKSNLRLTRRFLDRPEFISFEIGSFRLPPIMPSKNVGNISLGPPESRIARGQKFVIEGNKYHFFCALVLPFD
jgi:hypothetical protein